MKSITPEEAAELIQSGQATFIDVRGPEEFSTGHIPGAKNININGADFESTISALDKDATYVVNCLSGGRSSRACSLFDELGFTHANNLAGGITAWKAAGLPTE